MYHLTDWLTTPTIPFASKITSDTDRILHDHSFFEVFYLLDGTIEHTLNGTTSVLHAGDMLFLKPEDQHIFLRTANGISKHRDIIFRKSFFRTVCNYLSPELYDDFIADRVPRFFHLSAAKMKEFEDLLDRINAVPASELSLKVAAIRGVAAQVLGLLVSAQIENCMNYPDWLQELVQRFNDPAMICGGLDAILSDTFYTKEHVCRVFKQAFGVTMTDYLNNRRLELAAEQLAYTGQQVAAISLSLGFSSISYFNKIFKLKYGYTPVQFRKKSSRN